MFFLETERLFAVTVIVQAGVQFHDPFLSVQIPVERWNRGARTRILAV
jgi:hypothetical protein